MKTRTIGAAFAGLLAAALLGAALTPVAGAATITPDAATDDITNNGNCTLREAVQATNTNLPRDLCPAGDAAAPDRIVLEAPLYLLTLPGAGEIGNLTGDLDLIPTTSSPLTIESDLGESEIDGTSGANTDRVIEKSSGGGSSSLTLNRIRLDDGTPPAGESGGALRVVGATSVALNSSRVTNSDTDSRGGGMLVVDDLTLSNSTVSGNASTETTGEIGAGIRSNGDVTITASTITGNHVDSPDDAVVDDVLGGGISASIGSLTVVDSTISGNAVNVADTADTGAAAGIYAEDIPVTIENSTISGNTLTGSLGAGGGVFYRDSAPINGVLEIQNSTFSGNDGDFQGGGLQVFGGDAVVRNATFTANLAGTGRAFYYDDFGDAASSVSLGGSILSENGVTECGGPDPIGSHGYNIDRGTSCALINTGDQASTNPGLLGLAANGGPTLTRALPGGSAALDQIPSADCDQTDDTPLITDQRGAPRGFDEDGDSVAECDVGAYELNRCQGAIANLVGAGVINGTAAAEVIVGSGGGDSIDPREGNDRVCGGGGNDSVIERPNGDTDTVFGESGSDTLALGVAPPASPAGTIDLAGSTASQTGMSASLSSIENAAGSSAADTLIGDGGPNTLDGGIGNDAITGNGGPDTLIGGNNDDQLFARDGVGDSVDCGTGTGDTAQTDQLSLDSATGCESLDALAEPSVLLPTAKKCRKGFVKKKVKGKVKCVKKKKKKKK